MVLLPNRRRRRPRSRRSSDVLMYFTCHPSPVQMPTASSFLRACKVLVRLLVLVTQNIFWQIKTFKTFNTFNT